MRLAPLLLLPLLAAATAPSQDWDARFRALSDTEYAWRQQSFAEPEGEGAARMISPHLPDVSPTAQQARLARWQATLTALDAIPREQLSAPVQIDYAVYRHQIASRLAEQRFREWERPANSDTAFWDPGDLLGDKPLRSEQDYANALAKLAELPRWFDQEIANMRAGAARGFTPPRATLVGRDATIRAVADAGRAEDTPLWKPFETLPANIPASRRSAIQAQARTAIMATAKPAYAKLLAYWNTDYVPHANPVLAAEKLPDGIGYYRSKIAEFTTLDRSPEQIHAIGLKEVAAIRAEMIATMRETGFKGDLPAFLAMLRKDPRFYAKTPEELLRQAAWISKKFDGKAATWFGHLPRARFAIIPVPPAIAPTYTSGRGGPGVYLVNTYDLPARPLYQFTALTLHESAPGHAFQMPIAQENKDQPAWRRNGYISAYGEGWALYCERLGVEMGMYDTPYDLFGMLSFQMWRAARLVVDTGIHHDGWTRERAIAFLHDNTALADHDIAVEVDRYISWPGQALSYYLGEMAIRADRARAEKALGERFSIRAFHDAVLQLGSVPLPELDRRVDRFIAEGGKGPYPDEE